MTTSLSDLAYDIEQLYIEGFSPKSIAVQLGCPVSMVYDWINAVGCGVDEEASPYNTINS